MEKRINLFFGDVREKIRLIDDHSMDLIYWDHPYGPPTLTFNKPVPPEELKEDILRVAAPNCCLIVHTRQPSAFDYMAVFREWYEVTWYWPHPGSRGFDKQPTTIVDELLVFRLNPTGGHIKYHPPGYMTFTKIDDPYHPEWRQVLDNLLPYPVPKKFGETHYHRQERPVALLEYIVTTYTNQRDRVLDLFFGSGSMAVACLPINRKYYGIELSENCFHVAVNRILEFARSREYRKRKDKGRKIT